MSKRSYMFFVLALVFAFAAIPALAAQTPSNTPANHTLHSSDAELASDRDHAPHQPVFVDGDVADAHAVHVAGIGDAGKAAADAVKELDKNGAKIRGQNEAGYNMILGQVYA